MTNFSNELNVALETIRRELLSEERIRAIVREELEAHIKRQVQTRRYGLPPHVETK